MSNEEMLRKQREYRRNNGNAVTKKYERTKKGKLMRNYRNMESRVQGIQWRKYHLYQGKPILSRQDFYDWAMACPEFHRLFEEWEASNYDRKLSPTVDRIDPSKGYEPANMEWVTHSENSRRGASNRNSKKYRKLNSEPIRATPQT